MIPPTHFLISWVLANSSTETRRDRAIVTLAGVIPDIDGFGYPIENWLTFHWDKPLLWFSDYHHILCHNVGFAALVTVGAAWLSKGNWKTTLLACLTFHLHLLCDVAGSRGVDNYQWPVPYLLPFSDAWQWTWSGQWELSAWPNRAIGVSCFALTLWLAWRRGFSPLEMISSRADAAMVGVLRQWFPAKKVATASANLSPENLAAEDGANRHR